jgi:DNA ligase-associated metallophosphoesterase
MQGCPHVYSFRLAGAELVADHQGALWWPEQQLLAFADLHFEKGSAYASRTTQMLPPYDTHATLRLMGEIVARHSPKRIVCLGDNFHDEDGPSRLDASARQSLQALMKGRRFVWIEGNHDAAAALALGGESAPSLTIGPLVFRHEAEAESNGEGEVSGHFHPVVTVETRVRRIRRKCFVSNGLRCVMPALGAFTGGLDVLDEAFAPLFPGAFSTFALGRDRVYPFPQRSAEPAKRRLVPRVGL